MTLARTLGLKQNVCRVNSPMSELLTTTVILYVYVFRESCFQVIMYSVSAQDVAERIINLGYYHYHHYYYYS